MLSESLTDLKSQYEIINFCLQQKVKLLDALILYERHCQKVR